ncbi:MAG: hypothetical protein COV44_10020 [Deltaproteobacteria bacterium CG11_big_fil_rev_8_21_14_0_20_45_16]|nr:MAG: hypothetical protein COV44_10020 [Deltaproteobacteria bacterium CG11_big_fil_rev_8_21_14_0_20_45_16]
MLRFVIFLSFGAGLIACGEDPCVPSDNIATVNGYGARSADTCEYIGLRDSEDPNVGDGIDDIRVLR